MKHYRKVCMSLSFDCDNKLNEIKAATGLSKSHILALVVNAHGDELIADMQKYAKRGGTVYYNRASIE